MPRPLVSIVIPTYNLAEMLVGRSIRSVLKQSYREIECLVIDDGSTDDTEAQVRACAAADNRVRYIKKENGGQASARNLGIRESKGIFVVFHDHDDELFPTFVEEAVAAFEKLPEVSYMTSRVVNRHHDGRETAYIAELEPFWQLSVGNGWGFRSGMLTREHLLFDETMSGFEDLDFHIQLHEAGERGYIIPRSLRRYYVNLPRLMTGGPARQLPHGSERLIGGSYSSSNYGRQTDHFKKFLEKNQHIYTHEGSEAMAWLYGFYASLCLKAGRAREARRASFKALRYAPSLSSFRRAVLSLLGLRVYGFLYMLKLRIND